MDHLTFKAINGLLQGRLAESDIDYERANKLPEDFDSDIELEWSNVCKY